ncbi:MAG: hypothetical protein HUJ61_05815 [Bacilli bacterium]|nr:hypothetical protein [Bacilli bacterium]
MTKIIKKDNELKIVKTCDEFLYKETLYVNGTKTAYYEQYFAEEDGKEPVPTSIFYCWSSDDNFTNPVAIVNSYDKAKDFLSKIVLKYLDM